MPCRPASSCFFTLVEEQLLILARVCGPRLVTVTVERNRPRARLHVQEPAVGGFFVQVVGVVAVEGVTK